MARTIVINDLIADDIGRDREKRSTYYNRGNHAIITREIHFHAAIIRENECRSNTNTEINRTPDINK